MVSRVLAGRRLVTLLCGVVVMLVSASSAFAQDGATPNPFADAPSADLSTSPATAGPTIISDKDDYPPGGHVVLTGGGWQPGESVQIYVQDDQGQTWSERGTAVAGDDGTLTYELTLPNYFVATYSVEATGEVSGVARTSFTDGNGSGSNAASVPVGLTVTYTRTEFATDDATCTGSGSPVSVTATGPNATTTNFNLNPNRYYKVSATAPASTVSLSPTGACAAGTTASKVWTATVTAAKQNQTITFTAPTGKTYGDADSSLGATATSGLQVSYSSSTASVCTVVSGALRIVSAGDCTITATQAGNASYNAAAPVERTFAIAKAPLTIAASSVSSITYGSGTPTVAPTYATFVSGDTPSVLTSSPSCGTSYTAGSDVGTYATTCTGATAANYTITYQQGSLNVTPKALTGSFAASDKVYDGDTSATITNPSLSGVVGSDVVSLSGGSATFDTAAAGANKTVTGTGFSLGGDDKDNYSLASSELTTTASITEKGLVGHFAAADKTYDGNTDATIIDSSVTGGVGSDDVDLDGGNASFADADAGVDKVVTGSGFTLTGADSGNYSLSSVADTTATIFRKSLTGTFASPDRIYDGTTDADATDRGLNGVVAGDSVELTGGTASFVTAGVGTGKTVTLSAPTLTGPNASNYELDEPVTTTADITERALTGSFTAANKTYDGDATATVLSRSLDNVVVGDDVDLDGGTAAFEDRNVGTDKDVTLTGGSLIGAAAGNYELTSVDKAKADITAKGVTGSFKADDKVYNGLTGAQVSELALQGFVGGDDVALDGGPGAFDDKDVGDDKTVTLVDAALTGADAGNYELATPVTTTADITQRAVTGSFSAADKVYDGTTSATPSARTLQNTVDGDDISLTGGTATFENRNVGDDKLVTLAGASLSGASAGNYSLTEPVTATADITALKITGTFKSADKVYDGDTSADANVLALIGVLGDDDVSLVGGPGAFGDKNAGTGKTVTLVGAALSGDGSGNYSLETPVTTTADITAKDVTGTFAANDKVYDATTAATVASRSVVDAIAGDSVSLVGGTATFFTKNVADDKTVTLSDATLSGSDAGNYNLTSVATAQADITPAMLKVNALDKTITYNGSLPTPTYTLSGFVGGEDEDSAGISDAAACTIADGAGPGVGVYDDAITCAPGTLNATNYAFETGAKGKLTITRAALTIRASSPGNVILGGGAPTVNPSYSGFVAGDGPSALTTPPTCGTTYAAGDPVGLYTTTCSGAAAANYAISYVTGSFKVVYGWGGFLQPINDTAHQVGVNQSKFRLGSTVPVKFRLTNAAGTVIQVTPVPTFKSTKLPNACDSNTELEPVSTEPTDAGTAFKWDGATYHYNYSTKGLTPGEYRMYASVNDGLIRYVDICLTK